MEKRLYDDGYLVNYIEGDQSLERLPVEYSVGTGDKSYTVVELDTLQSIAFKFYGRSSSWYNIADANNIFNPFELEVGQVLIIPNKNNF